ncbi:MAG: metallophosphoesterase family protein [Phycisphaerales bacterium]|nr:metallophosphoesterase family protein [Phycisphaerales bacterium]MCB9856424.1 metallophosphoesterase family protein [Phycisphaerales bacterium]MCB9864555.1 metallophosphoesterase family protein [Phycisphaerales bacterium]
MMSIVIGMTTVVSAIAHDDQDHPHEHAPPKRDAAKEYAPSEMPDRIVLTWTHDPKTTQTVTWRTSDNIQRAYAEIAPVTAGPDFRESRTKQTAKTQAFQSDLSKCHFHSVEFTGLTPGTKYAYRLGDDVNWSEWFHFRTASDTAEPFSFVYFGDAQNEVRSMWSRIVREAFSDAPRAAFMLHAGDLINDPNHDEEWGEWFYAGSWITAHIPVVATPGNHEYARRRILGVKANRILSPYWRAQFAFPLNGPKGLEESAYYFDYQDVRIVSLNSNEELAIQWKWLDHVLTKSDRKWNILTFHHPIVPMARQRGASDTRAWMGVIDEHHVDLVLTGHDHTYGRSDLVTREENLPEGINWRSEKGGTVYVVSVSGPKMYQVDDEARERMAKTGERVQLYQIISIDGDVLKYESRSADGCVFDAFELQKGANGRNEMRGVRSRVANAADQPIASPAGK